MKIALRTIDDWYVCADLNRSGLLTADRRPPPGSWEKFELTDNGDGTFSLKAADGKLVRAVGGGGGDLIADRTVVGPWEKFVWVPQPFGKAGIKCHNGKFWSAVGGGGGALTASADDVRVWERFTREDLPELATPTHRASKARNCPAPRP